MLLLLTSVQGRLNLFLYLLSRITDGHERFSELHPEKALDSEDELNSKLLFFWEGLVTKNH